MHPHIYTHTHTANGIGLRFWFCAIISILFLLHSFFPALSYSLSILASNCLTILLRLLDIRSVHDVCTWVFNFYFFLGFIHSEDRTKIERKKKKGTKSKIHTVHYQFVNAGHACIHRHTDTHTHRNCILTKTCKPKEVHSIAFLCVRSIRTVRCVVSLHFMIHDDDDAMLWNHDEKSQFTYLFVCNAIWAHIVHIITVYSNE